MVKQKNSSILLQTTSGMISSSEVNKPQEVHSVRRGWTDVARHASGSLSPHLSTCLIACLQTFQAIHLAWLHSNQLQLPNYNTLYASLHDGVIQPQVQQEQLLMQEVPAQCDL